MWHAHKKFRNRFRRAIAGVANAVRTGGNNGNQLSHEAVYLQGKEIREEHGNGKSNGSGRHTVAELQRNGFSEGISSRRSASITAGGEGSGCKEEVAESYGSSGGPKCLTRANVPKNWT